MLVILWKHRVKSDVAKVRTSRFGGAEKEWRAIEENNLPASERYATLQPNRRLHRVLDQTFE